LFIAGELESSQQLEKCLNELNECRTRETQLLEKFRDGTTFVYSLYLLLSTIADRTLPVVGLRYSRADCDIHGNLPSILVQIETQRPL